MGQVKLRSIAKSFGPTAVLDDINLQIEDKEFVVVVGPSGCGKSTLLRVVAGLEEASAGTLLFDGRAVNTLSPGERNVAMVFQNYALYPHLSVAANIGFGLRRAAMSRRERRDAVERTARLLEIEPLLKRRPGALSGGQRQRVAMGRAIIRNPAVFLFDEPLSNLDARLRMQMRSEIRTLHGKVPTTTIYVTHDQIEAMTMADRVVVMNAGRIEQIGTPSQIYDTPRTTFVARFMGMPSMNMLAARLDGDALVLPDGRIPVPADWPARLARWAGREVLLGLRPEHLSLRASPGGIPATVDLVEPTGSETLVYLHHGDTRLSARTPPETRVRRGERVHLDLRLDRATLFDPETALALPTLASDPIPTGEPA